MAPNYTTADINYGQAVFRLQTACTLLERHLPPLEDGQDDEIWTVPSLRPKMRLASVPACQQCEEELGELDAGDRAAHQCNHRRGGAVQTAVDDSARTSAVKGTRGRQQNAGVIRHELENMSNKFDAFTVAVATFCSLMDDDIEISLYEGHLLKWTDYYGWMRDRAEGTIALLEPIVNNDEVVTQNVPVSGAQETQTLGIQTMPVTEAQGTEALGVQTDFSIKSTASSGRRSKGSCK